MTAVNMGIEEGEATDIRQTPGLRQYQIPPSILNRGHAKSRRESLRPA